MSHFFEVTYRPNATGCLCSLLCYTDVTILKLSYVNLQVLSQLIGPRPSASDQYSLPRTCN